MIQVLAEELIVDIAYFFDASKNEWSASVHGKFNSLEDFTINLLIKRGAISFNDFKDHVAEDVKSAVARCIYATKSNSGG